MRDNTVTTIRHDFEGLTPAFGADAFERFSEQIDVALDELVARWIDRAAPVAFWHGRRLLESET